MAIDARTVRQVRRELDFDEAGVVDEMGVGALHSGYANRYFPGTSVLQTRARYVFFVAWNFLTLRRFQLPAVRQRKLDYEAEVTKRLIAHYGQVDGKGILGVRIAPDPPAQPPDFVYWTALQTWKLCSSVPRSTLLTRWDPKRVVRRDDRPARREEEVGEGVLAQFDVPEPPARWPRDAQMLTFDLTAEEAEWLRVRWTRIESPCLLRECAQLMERRGRRPQADTLWLDGPVREAAQRLDARGAATDVLPSFVKSLAHARGASALAELVRATYAAFVERECERDLIAEGRKVDDASRYYRELLDEYFRDAERAATLEEALRADVDAVVGDLPEIATTSWRLDRVLRETQTSWLRARKGGTIGNDEKLREVYEVAERKRKVSRARLAPLEGRERRRGFEDGDVNVTGLDYRWTVTRRLMGDVYRGIHGETRG